MSYDEEFIGQVQMAHQLYGLDDIELAEQAMLSLEENILAMKGNPEVYGVQRKEDFLFKTQLRLWGIYHFSGDIENMALYQDKLRLLMKDTSASISDEELLVLFDEADGNLKPNWMGLREKEWFPKGMTLEEMEGEGWIKRVN